MAQIKEVGAQCPDRRGMRDSKFETCSKNDNMVRASPFVSCPAGGPGPFSPPKAQLPKSSRSADLASMKRVKRLDKAKWLLHRCQRLKAPSLSLLLCLGRRTCGGVACGGHHCPKLATARDSRVRCRFARHELSQAITGHHRLLQLLQAVTATSPPDAEGQPHAGCVRVLEIKDWMPGLHL